ncbi:DNRLRE domain-containing protein [Pendulispora brunnea]|uniref:DNRLRE domain-containing protein n=1 Tax=Pendulispora brunnea TaxID=2905690 RepID=A0ABZ2KP70_9BACT
MKLRACLLCLASLAFGVLAGCVARPRMCVASSECGARQSCVVGRCQDSTGVPLIQKKEVRRLVLEPVAIGYVQRGRAASEGALPPIFTLGRSAGGDSRLYLRFAVPPAVAKDTAILEAYVLLDRSLAVQPDPTPIVLHAARVVTPWDPRSISWSYQPRIEDASAGGSPATRVVPAARHVVRVDVRDIVQRWRSRDARDQGIVIVADNSTEVGMAFALASGGSSGGSSAGSSGAGNAGGGSGAEAADSAPSMSPRLELYLAPEPAR